MDAGESLSDVFPDYHSGWALWPPIRYSYNTEVERRGAAPLPPNSENWLGTDQGIQY